MTKLDIKELQKIIRESISEEIKKEGWGTVRRSRGWDLDDDHYESAEDFAPDDGDVKKDRETGERMVWSGDEGKWIYEEDWQQMNLAKRAKEEAEEDLDETASISSVDGKNTTLMPESHKRFLGVVKNSLKVNEQKKKSEKKPIKEHRSKKTMTFGQIPPAEELFKLMNGEEFHLNLQGEGSLAFEYAVRLSQDPLAGSLAPGKGMESTLQALVNAPSPSEIPDEEYETVQKILDHWYSRYGEDHPIEEAAWSIASDIMGVLGIEWI